MLKMTKSIAPVSGFTILELVIVMFIVSIMTAMSLPVLIRQVAKAKETEGIKMLSSIGFLQQGYFFEHREFAPDYTSLALSTNANHFDFPPPNTPAGGQYTISQAVTKNSGLDASRNYSIGVYYDNDNYRIILCQSSTPGGAVSAPSSYTGSCIGGTQIN